MDKSSLKITELPALSVASENGFIPIAQVKEENDTYKTTLRALRESIMFENAYLSTATGVSATVPGDVFFVYTDDTKEHVQGWVNSAGGATPLLNANSEQVTYGTYALLNKALKDKGAIVQWVYNGGLSNGGEQTFTVPLTGNISVQEVYVDGLRQFKDVGFELVAGNALSFKLATPVKENQTVVAICFGSDDVEKVNEAFLATYTGPNGASNIGVQGGGTVQSAIDSFTANLGLLNALSADVYTSIKDTLVDRKADNYVAGSFKEYQVAQFKSAQYVKHYYDILGNWDDAIYMAQANVFIKGYSPTLIFPAMVITINKPILGGRALGEKLHSDFPQLGLYNSGTNSFTKPISLVIKGTYGNFREGLVDDAVGTQFVFSGCASQADNTFQNMGIIHFGPTDPSTWNKSMTTSDQGFSGGFHVTDINIRVLNKDNSRFGKIHGILCMGTHMAYGCNIKIYQCYGAGLLCDWLFDSTFDQFSIVQCGRQAGSISTYSSLGYNTTDYQLYAALHILYTPSGSDNTNFVRFNNFHMEDNYHGAADVIVSGDSSPIWLNDFHFEIDSAANTTTGNKVAIALGNFGVRYTGQDTVAGFDPSVTPYNAKAGYANIKGVVGYSTNYAYGLRIKGIGGAIMSDCVYPAFGNVQIQGSNGAAALVASNCRLGTINVSGSSHANPLMLTNVVCTSITGSYINGVNLSNVRMTGAMTFTNLYSNVAYPHTFSNVVADTVSASFGYASGDITLTSTTTAPVISCKYGKIVIPRCAYYNTVTLNGAL